MGFNLNLTIRGLCAFVPLDPLVFGERQTIGRMKVLVVDARVPKEISGERTEEPLEICAHIPELRLPNALWLLSDHRIEISGIDEEVPLLIEPSFGRLAQMEKAAPGSERVQEKFLAPDPPEGLVANLDLFAGSVEALAPKPKEWVFQPPLVQPPYRDRFASMVHVQLPIKDNEAVLRAVPVRGGTAFEERLKPKPNQDSVELFLVNMCPPAEQHGKRDKEEDFAVFYDLSKDYTGTISIPHKAKGPNGQRGTVRGEASAAPACIPGGFKG